MPSLATRSLPFAHMYPLPMSCPPPTGCAWNECSVKVSVAMSRVKSPEAAITGS